MRDISEINIDGKPLLEILKSHALWLDGGKGGVRAHLVGANLMGARLHGADLCGASLIDASLNGANLIEANLEKADLYGADLCGANLLEASLVRANLAGANLFGANLFRVNLAGANLFGARGNDNEIKSLQIGRCPVVYTAEIIQIGSERHTIDEWHDFDDRHVVSMGRGMLEFWRKAKPIIFAAIESFPATPIEKIELEGTT